MNCYPGLDDDRGRCGHIHRSRLIVAVARSLALTFFLVFATFLKLAFNFAVSVPILFLVLASIMSSTFAMTAFIFPRIC